MSATVKIVSAEPSSIATQRVKKAAQLLADARKDDAQLVVQEAATIEEAALIADHAGALEKLTRRRDDAAEAHEHAFYILQHARRRIGQLALALPRDKGGRPPKEAEPGPDGETVVERATVSKKAQLAAMGIGRPEARQYEAMAKIADDEFEQRVTRSLDDAKKKGRPISITRQRGPLDRDSYGTPPPYAEAMHEFFEGPPDLDPASNPMANNVIRALKFYTKDDSGLEDANGVPVIWRAKKLWINSPFSGALVKLFQAKFITEFDAGHFEQGLSLVNADTSVTWFQELMSRFPVCFPDERIAFLHPETGEPVKGNEYPQAIFYAGPQRERFREIFGRFGAVMIRMPAEAISAA